MHIVLIEPVMPLGAVCVSLLADAGHEVTLIVQDLSAQQKMQTAGELDRASSIIEVPELGHGIDLYAHLASKWEGRPPEGIICHCDSFRADAEQLAQALGLPSELSKTAQLLSNKSALREFLATTGIQVLSWKQVESIEELLAITEYPVIIKKNTYDFFPQAQVVVNQDDLIKQWNIVEKTAGQFFITSHDMQSPCVCTSGCHIAADVLVQNGTPHLLGYSEYKTEYEGDITRSSRYYNSNIASDNQAFLQAREIISHLNIQNSAVHVEFIISSQGPILVDIKFHIGGYSLIRQLSLSLNRCIMRDQVAIATGKQLVAIDPPDVGSVSLLVERRIDGIVLDIKEPLSMPPQIADYQVLVSPGDLMTGEGHATYPIGLVVASGPDEPTCCSQALVAAERISNSVNVARVLLDRSELVKPKHHCPNPKEGQAKTHVLLLDRKGPESWTLPNGKPVLSEDRYRLSVFSTSLETGHEGVIPDFSAQFNIFDLPALNVAAQCLHSHFPVERISSCSELVLPDAAALRNQFGAPGASMAYTNSFIDKAVMKRLAQRSNIKCAEGCVVDTIFDIDYLRKKYQAVVVKPRARTGSQGVSILRTDAEVNAWLVHGYKPGEFLAEEYIEGDMCHIDAVVYDDNIIWNMSIYSRDTLAYTRGQPISSISPSDKELRSDAYDLLGRIIEGWQVKKAVLHIEAFITDSGLIFCEVAARPGGGGIGDAFLATRGINTHHAQLLIDCDENPFQYQVDPIGEYSGWTIHYTQQAGVLEYFDDTAVINSTFKRKLLANPGESVPMSTFSGTGISMHMFISDEQQKVHDLVKLAEKNIFYKII